MSKEKLLLVGAGGFGRVVSELAGQKYECAFIDDGIEVGTVICGIPVIGHSVDDFALIYTNSVVRTYAKVGKRVRIGSNCTICNNATVPDGADIPDCTAVR